jgi:Co/Zn/Cd efflux system component
MQLLANMVAWNNGNRRLSRATQTCNECDEIHSPNKAQRDIHELKQNNVASKNNKPPASKEYVLNIAFFSFVAFCILETVFAVLASSESMMADAQAMSIDALTYLFNLAAEHVKNQPLSKASLLLSLKEQARRLELRKLYLELVPPAISVVVLIMITAKTFLEAFNTLRENPAAQAGDGEEEEEDVSVQLMLGFSAANLLLDIINVMCFHRANSMYGLDVVVGRGKGAAKGIVVGPSLQDFDFRTIMAEEGSRLLSSDDKQDQPSETATGSTTPSSTMRYSEYGSFHKASSSLDDDDDDCASISSTDSSTSSGEMVNLNMCSAWTHVCADTLRSTAVLIAASIATLFPAIPGETADAAAAIAVSIIILVSVIPLIQGLVLTAIAIQYLHRNPTLNNEGSSSTTTTTTTTIRLCHDCSC